MSEKKFNEGDLVKLKSGGPVMTVDHYYLEPLGGESSSRVFCKWFDDKNNPQTGWFDEGALEIAEAE
jgi:uncharacterized protein YodC (DUF2158 family)